MLAIDFIITVMHRIKTFHSTLDRIYDGGPIKLIIQGVPLPTKPGSSLIIPKPMKILQRDLNRSTFVV